MELRLKILSGNHTGHEMRISREKFLIGRSAECQLRPNSEQISRHHCVLLLEEGRATIRDLGSRNGTLVNGERIQGEVELAVGDRLVIGPLEFEVRLIAPAAALNEPAAKEAAVRAPIEKAIAAEKVAPKARAAEKVPASEKTPGVEKAPREAARSEPVRPAARPAGIAAGSPEPQVGEDLAAWLLDSLTSTSEEDTKDFSKTDILLKPQAATPTAEEAAKAEADALRKLNQRRRR